MSDGATQQGHAFYTKEGTKGVYNWYKHKWIKLEDTWINLDNTAAVQRREDGIAVHTSVAVITVPVTLEEFEKRCGGDLND